MEETYELECEVCDSITEVVVYDNDEEPQYCPMCGSQLN